MEYNKKDPNYILIAFVFIQIIYLIIIGSFIINAIKTSDKIENPNKQPSVTIKSTQDNYLPLQESDIDYLSHGLTEAIALNTTNFNIPDSPAIVRNDSIILTEFDYQQSNALSFIVDIPNLEQSYQIYYKYPMDTTTETTSYAENPYAVLCLEDKAQIIYPEFDCHSSYPSDTRYRIATDYIKLFEFNQFTISLDSNDPHLIVINPITDVDAKTSESYIAEVKSAIASLGVSPDMFKYHVQSQSELNFVLPPEDR